jgi:hypothetical protein
MAKIKNLVIAAIVAAITTQIAKDGTTPEQKAELQSVIDSLTGLDIALATDQANADAAVKELENKLSVLSQDKAAGDVFIIDLEGKLATANETLNQPFALPADVKLHIVQLEDEREEALDVIKDLQDQLKVALDVKAKASDVPVGEYENQKYEVLSGSHMHGSAAEIAADPEKIGEILKINGQQILKPLNA